MSGLTEEDLKNLEHGSIVIKKSSGDVYKIIATWGGSRIIAERRFKSCSNLFRPQPTPLIGGFAVEKPQKRESRRWKIL